MAHWTVGGTEMSRSSSASSIPDDFYDRPPPFLNTRKRRAGDPAIFAPHGGYDTYAPIKRLRPHPDDPVASIEVDCVPAFFIIREDGRYSRSDPGELPKWPRGRRSYSDQDSLVESTESESSTPYLLRPVHASDGIGACDTNDQGLHYVDGGDLDDKGAAKLVDQYLADHRRRHRDPRGKRILRSLICPKSPKVEFELDDNGLESIFLAANDIFFGGRLRGRVSWRWSDSGNAMHQSRIIGTTALREAAPDIGGYETLIMLSEHFLKDKRYNRRLLISTFLHELVHCYLFISCGFKAKRCGGHTEGFKRIAELIDDWVGPDILFLRNIEADLGDFLAETSEKVPLHGHRHMSADSHIQFQRNELIEDHQYGPAWIHHSHRTPYYSQQQQEQHHRPFAISDHHPCVWSPYVAWTGRTHHEI